MRRDRICHFIFIRCCLHFRLAPERQVAVGIDEAGRDPASRRIDALCLCRNRQFRTSHRRDFFRLKSGPFRFRWEDLPWYIQCRLELLSYAASRDMVLAEQRADAAGVQIAGSVMEIALLRKVTHAIQRLAMYYTFSMKMPSVRAKRMQNSSTSGVIMPQPPKRYAPCSVAVSPVGTASVRRKASPDLSGRR